MFDDYKFQMEKFKPFLADFISYYYNELGNAAGGNYHIVLDDGNTDAGFVWDCQERALKEGDTFGIFLGELLRCFTDEEREALYQRDWKG